MADLVTDTPVPTGDLVTSTPIPETTTVTPQQADVTATRLTEGAFSRGARAGFNQMGAMGEGFLGNLGETLGLTDFAASRFKEAEDYVRFADEVSPAVKDYRQVKDFDTLMQYVLGAAGQAAAMFVPGVVGATVGAKVGGVRGAFAGAGAGSFVPNAGEQAMRIRNEGGTPGSRTANMLAVGGVNAALDTFLPGGAAARMIKPGLRQGAGKALLKSTAIEGATEGAQEVTGQIGHTAINPNRDKSGDTADVINSALQGAIGGAGFGAVSHAAELAPSAAARTLDTLKSKVNRIEDVTDSSDLSKIISDPNIGSDPEAISRAVDELDTAETSSLERVAKAMGKTATEIGDTLSDPEARAKFMDDAKKWVNDHRDAPRVKSALASVRDHVSKAMEAAKQGAAEARAQPNLQRTKLDEQVLDLVKTNMSDTARNNMTPTEMIEFAGAVKHAAMYGPKELPPGMLMILGDKTVQTLNDTNKIIGQGKSMQTPPDFKQALKETARSGRERNDRLGNIIREHLQDDIFADPEKRKVAIEGFRRMLNDTSAGSSERLQDAAVHMFNDPKKAMDAIQDKGTQDLSRQFDLTDEELNQFDSGVDTTDTQTSDDVQTAESEDFGGRQAVQRAWEDQRVNRTYATLTEAKAAYDAVTQGGEYDPKQVRFDVHEQVGYDPDTNTEQPTGRYTLQAKDAEGTDALSPQQWKDIRNVGGHSGFENGVVTVRTKQSPGGIPISIPRATSFAMSAIDRPGQSETYVPDMVLRGLGMVMGDANVTGLGTKTSQELEGQRDLASWDIPDNTLVAVHKGTRWTWGDVKKTMRDVPQQAQVGYWKDIVKELDDKVEAARADGTLGDKVGLAIYARDKKIAMAAKGPAPSAKAAEAAAKARAKYSESVRQYAQFKEEGKSGFFEDGSEPAETAPGKSEMDEFREARDRALGSKERLVQEETGLPTQGEVGRAGKGRAYAKHETGIEDTGSTGLDTTFLAEGKEAMPVTKGNLVPPKKLSMQAVGEDRLTKEQKLEATAYIAKVLGKDADVVFRNMAEAGSFANIDGLESIAISNFAMDHMGVARHEAAHALLKRLMKADKKASQTLLAAANSPHIVTRLKKLLDGHPEAIKQLSDPQERVAYMYQFWAADQMKVGPKTQTWFDQVKRFFRRVAAVWSETAPDVFNVEKAEAIFDLFDQGELANRNTVAEVLRDKLQKTPYERADELMGPMWKFVDKALFTADGYVRSMNNAAFNGVMDKMYTPLGRQNQEPGFIQAKHQVANEFLNEVDNLLGEATEAHKREAIEALQSGRPAGTQEARRIVAGVRVILRNAFDYMDKKGVKAVVWNDASKKYDELAIGFIENYFPRYYDRDYIFSNRVEFEAMLKRNKLDAVQAHEVYLNVTRVSKAAPDENDFAAGLTYYAPNTQARKLDLPASELAPFLIKDLHASLASYVSYVARRGEYASRFGNQGKVIEDAAAEAVRQGATTEQVKGFNQAIQALEGTLGHDINSQTKAIMGGLVTYQNVRLLPLALFASLVDPLGIAVRGGGLGESFGAFVRGIRGLVSESKDAAYDLARTAGTIATSHDDHMIADAYGTQYMTGMQRKIGTAFFKYNGMESWNRSMRVQATAAAERFIIRHVQKPNEHSARYLAELNLQPADIRIVDDSLVLNDKVKQALNLWVDGAVLRPNAAIRPIWMSDPHWMLVSHLKQFTYSFQKVVIARAVHELENGNYTPALSLLSYVPAIIAADVARALLTPGTGDNDRLEKMGLSGILARGVQRAGLFGPGQYALDAYGDLGHEKIPLASIAGPTFQQVYDMGVAAASPKGNIGHELARAMPGYVLVK